MKLCLTLYTLLFLSPLALAQSHCDVRVGETLGVKVMEFSTGHIVHSKMSLVESTPDAILEEMINLQNMEICSEKIISKKCVLKFEKKTPRHSLTLYRGEDRWQSWSIDSKKDAQNYVNNLDR